MDSYDPMFWFLKGSAEPRVVQWHSTDTAESYSEDLVSGKNPFKPGDFDYSFNANGFRCEEFNLPSDLQTVFCGCSNTEGVGLPLENVWAHCVLQQMREKTGLTIPYWNTAVSGGAVDTMASQLFYIHRKTKIRPKLVIGWIPPLYVRDFSFRSSKEFHYSNVPGSRHPVFVDELITPVFTDKYFYHHQAVRSLRMISLICEMWDAKMVMACRGGSGFDVISSQLQGFTHVQIPQLRTCDARDGMHYGAPFHKELAGNFWKKIEPLLSELQP